MNYPRSKCSWLHMHLEVMLHIRFSENPWRSVVYESILQLTNIYIYIVIYHHVSNCSIYFGLALCIHIYIYIYISYNILITLYNYIIVYSPSSEAVTIHETILRWLSMIFPFDPHWVRDPATFDYQRVAMVSCPLPLFRLLRIIVILEDAHCGTQPQ